MSARIAVLLVVGVVLVGGCKYVKQEEFEAHKAAMKAWIGEPSEPNNTPYQTFFEWAEHISDVVCALEDLDAAHNAAASDDLCPGNAGGQDPKAPPPDPPPLNGD